jgi:hypothetical protein
MLDELLVLVLVTTHVDDDWWAYSCRVKVRVVHMEGWSEEE